jgi:hypothetical protein
MSFEKYIQAALAEELKVAGMFEEERPRVTLTGVVEALAFSAQSASSQSASWDIGLRVTSSNGKSTLVREYYAFAPAENNGCKQIAEAYLPAVQYLLGKLVRSHDFKALVTP